jgi:hypothetical protein
MKHHRPLIAANLEEAKLAGPWLLEEINTPPGFEALRANRARIDPRPLH